MAHPVLQHRHVNFLTSRASPFGLCFHFPFRHNGFPYKKQTRISPRVTTQRCRHWRCGMAIANANAEMRCTKVMIWGGAKRMGIGKRTRQRTLPKFSGRLQKSFWSAQSWIFVQETHRALSGRRTRRRGRSKTVFGRGVLPEVFLPPLFSTPPWCPQWRAISRLRLQTQLAPSCP